MTYIRNLKSVPGLCVDLQSAGEIWISIYSAENQTGDAHFKRNLACLIKEGFHLTSTQLTLRRYAAKACITFKIEVDVLASLFM